MESKEHLQGKHSFKKKKKKKKSLSNPIASLKPSVLEILEPPLLIGIRVLKSLQVCESQPVAFILSSSLTSFVALVTLFNHSEPWFLIHKMGAKIPTSEDCCDGNTRPVRSDILLFLLPFPQRSFPFLQVDVSSPLTTASAPQTRGGPRP